MKIGVVSIGNDSLELFRFLQKYDCDYHIYYDANSWPLGDKDIHTAESIIKEGIDYLSLMDVDFIIIPPLWELIIRREKGDTRNERIIPLFETYLLECCFKYSLVGKIGILSDPVGLQSESNDGKFLVQKLLTKSAKKHIQTDNQKAIERFQFPFSYRCKDVRMWKYFLRSLQPRNFLINKVIKFDLHYFKDAMVDTIIPMSYSFFAFEKTIKRYFNFKKQRFHDMDSLKSCFEKFVLDKGAIEKGKYSVKVYYKGDKGMLESRKRYLWMLQRGKEIELVWKEIGG